MAVPLSLFSISPFATVIAIPVSWTLLLAYFSRSSTGELPASGDLFHTLLQNYMSGCALLFIASIALLCITFTCFPSNSRIAYDAVQQNDIVRLRSVISKLDRDKHLDLLNDAAEFAGPQIVECLLHNGWDPNNQDFGDYRTPLHRVVRNRNDPIGFEIASILLAHGADPSIEDAYGNTAEESARFYSPGILTP